MSLKLNGYIVPDDYVEIFQQWGMSVSSPKVIDNWLKSGDPDMTLLINSPGGSMFSGIEMYTLIKNHGGVDVLISGMAASAAVLPAIAGKTVSINPAGMLMIHNVSMGADGDHNAMEKARNELLQANAAISQAYRVKTGLEEGVLLEMMNRETWMTAADAMRFGFVDSIAFGENHPPSADGTLFSERGQGNTVFNARQQLAVNINKTNSMRRTFR